MILKNNLFGLDLCKRASQLAQLAVLLRAREDDKQIFNKYQELNIRYIENSKEITNEEIAFVAEQNNGEDFDKVKEFVKCFENADIYGSLCKLPSVDYNYYFDKIDALKNKMSESLFLNSTTIYNKFLPLLKQFKIMQQQYECVITNPPYMGNKYMETKLAEFIQKEYKDVKSDLFSAFMVYCKDKTVKNGHMGFMTPMVWMFITSYENLRETIINNTNISSLVQLEYSGFEGATVPICTFTLENKLTNKLGTFVRLTDFPGAKNQPIKTLEAVQNKDCGFYYEVNNKSFHSIPGSPIAYWAGDRVREIFKKEEPLKNVGLPRVGLQTSDNNRFLRLWHEINIKKAGFGIKNREHAKESKETLN